MSDAHDDPIDCAESGRRLWAFLDGALPPPSADEVRRHVAHCTCCGRVHEAERRLLELVSDLSSEDDATLAELRARVRRLLEEEARRG